MLSMQEQKTKESKISMYVVVLIVWMYVLYSSIPHGVTNLRSASYWDYKLWGMSEENALMRFHPEYFNILFELNIWDEYKNDFFIKYRNDLLKILDSTSFADKVSSQIQWVGSMAHLHDAIKQIIRFDLGNESANKQVEELQQRLYEDIIFVSKEEGNTENIHRIWTFLKYYISENNTRFYEDSLLTRFNDYLYDDDFDTVVERYQKLDIWYILLDINAATIDRDPSRNLTQRYEKMLMLATNSNLKLIETDSVCLRVALDVYKKDKNLEKYMDMAAVNYSYKKSSQQKKTICVQEIVKILWDWGALKQYPYLAPYIWALERAKIPLDDKEKVQNALVWSIKNGYKVLFKINKD
jgi:hypothetical protein